MEVAFSVSEFVAVLNQTLEYAYGSVLVSGELANFRVSKNRWVYFDLKDDGASVRCFGTVYQLPGPLEDGMTVQVRAMPRLHQQYGFSLNLQAIQVSGEGNLKRAADLLAAKLTAEGLFAPEHKRPLPYPPARVGLVASGESAAYVDFLKVLGGRWGGLTIQHIDVQVQGELAVAQLVWAIQRFNELAEVPQVLVITRGGGSADDLAAFNAEPVVRAIAASRIPTLVAIGHEVDVSLAELAADQRASTPSNAAELLVPDRRAVLQQIDDFGPQARRLIQQQLQRHNQLIDGDRALLRDRLRAVLERADQHLGADERLLQALNPMAPLERGYTLIYQHDKLVRRQKDLQPGSAELRFTDGRRSATIKPND